MIAFGPVPSRRLGRSLGINNIPPKICTYSCVYCQLGRTLKMEVDRRAFYEPEQVGPSRCIRSIPPPLLRPGQSFAGWPTRPRSSCRPLSKSWPESGISPAATRAVADAASLASV